MATSDRFINIIRSLPFEDFQHYYKIGLDYGIIDFLLYPFDYADTLIRLGYEPFPPVEVSHIFESPSLILPGLTSFVYYLYEIDGFTGCFRSVVPYVGSSLIYRHLTSYLISRAPFKLERPSDEPRLCAKFTEGNLMHFAKLRGWKILSNITALHFSYPLYAIGVRTIARFVTRGATKEGYRPLIEDSWIFEFWKLRGIVDLYLGMQARVCRELVFGLLSAGTFLVFMKFLQIIQADVQNADTIESSIDYISNSLGTMWASSYRNVGDIMIVNGTDIPLGNPPFIKHFDTCWECLGGLRQDFKWKTSSGGLLSGRRFTGPIDISGGHPQPTSDTYFGPFYFPVNTHGFKDAPYMLSDYYKVWNELGVQPGTEFNQFKNSARTGRRDDIVGELKPMKAMFPQILGLTTFFGINDMASTIAYLKLITNPFSL